MPHCLSPTSNVESVEFDAALFNGGIILPDKTLPSDLGRQVPRKEEEKSKTITVQCFPLQSGWILHCKFLNAKFECNDIVIFIISRGLYFF